MFWELILVAVITGLIGLGIWLYRKIFNVPKRIHRLPVELLGFHNVPAIPVVFEEVPKTLLSLQNRATQLDMALNGLSQTYSIGGYEATAYAYMFGAGAEIAPGSNVHWDELTQFQMLADALKGVSWKKELSAPRFTERMTNPDPFGQLIAKSKAEAVYSKGTTAATVRPKNPFYDRSCDDPIQQLALEKPEQFTMSISTFTGLWQEAQQYLPEYQDSLTDPDTATRLFWPMIAENGLAYNLLMLQKVNQDSYDEVWGLLGEKWEEQGLEPLYQQGLLYFIDLNVFQVLESHNICHADRFTPATFTLLKQDPTTKELSPFIISVAGHQLSNQQWYIRNKCTEGAWLYALQAAKASVTVYGIWLGHVYIWHIVTAAAQMTFFNTIPKDHKLYNVLSRQFNYVIPFDDALLFLWRVLAPPTSVYSSKEFLKLINAYAPEFPFEYGDPLHFLNSRGIQEEDFSKNEAWDLFPMAGILIRVWKHSEDYVNVWVDELYDSDDAVQNDEDLQKWMKASADRSEGNIIGWPSQVKTRFELKSLLTNLIYRVTAHGTSRLNSARTPFIAFAYLPNFPPCLQRTDIPSPEAAIETSELLKYLPNTGTIGQMVTFYYIFVFSAPYVPFVPLSGVSTDLFSEFPESDPRNQALIRFREAIISINKGLNDDVTQVSQWPLNIET